MLNYGATKPAALSKTRVMRGDTVTFRDPETSRMKTSFHRKVSLQNATGIFHPLIAPRLGKAQVSGRSPLAQLI